jgi:predicted nucleotidyltransferase
MNKFGQTVLKNNISRPTLAKERIATKKRAAVSFADKIPFIRSLVLDSVKPGVIKKIYLFGSYAYGKPKKNSDIDLCVVINNRFDRLNTNVKIARSLYDNDIMPVDLLVYKENQFYGFTNQNGIEKIIVTEGKVLYG